MPFSEEHERLVAIETALGCLLFEVIKAGENPAATRESFSTGMREVAAAYPQSAMTQNANPDSIVRAFGTFILGGEINLCKQYKSKFTLDQLCLDFDRVDARAPSGSVAEIGFRLNAHREWSGKIYVMVRDGRGKIARVDNIYKAMPILLGPNDEFFVKLARDEGLEFEDSTELWVTIEAWTK